MHLACGADEALLVPTVRHAADGHLTRVALVALDALRALDASGPRCPVAGDAFHPRDARAGEVLPLVASHLGELEGR